MIVNVRTAFIACCVSIIGLFLWMAVSRGLSLTANFFDTGTFQNIFFNISDHGQLGRIFFGRAHMAAFPYLAIHSGIPDSMGALAIVHAAGGNQWGLDHHVTGLLQPYT